MAGEVLREVGMAVSCIQFFSNDVEVLGQSLGYLTFDLFVDDLLV